MTETERYAETDDAQTAAAIMAEHFAAVEAAFAPLFDAMRKTIAENVLPVTLPTNFEKWL